MPDCRCNKEKKMPRKKPQKDMSRARPKKKAGKVPSKRSRVSAHDARAIRDRLEQEQAGGLRRGRKR
jgi:hypothetical protein